MNAEPAARELPVEVIPEELRDQPQWVVWRYEERDGKPTKVPYEARGRYLRASSTDRSTWSEFQAALGFYKQADWTSGIGFVLNPDDPYVGVDLDHCIAESVAPWARAVVRRLNSYTEITPSGSGLRVFVKGHLPPGGRKKNDFEVYDRGRFLTVTGNRISSTSAVAERSKELAEIHAEIFGREIVQNGVAHKVNRSPLSIGDAELLAKARAASNGAQFWALWNGDASGYGSPSEADLALCSHLAWWTSGSPSRTDQLFRQSSLMRAKWDEQHGDRTYGQRTVDKALSTMTSFYEPGFSSTTPRLRLVARPGEPPPNEDEPLAMTDMGNGQRLVARYGHALRYCHPWSKWLAWDGSRWKMDDTGAVWRCAKATARAIFQEAASVQNVELAKALGRHAVRTQADSKLAAMIHQAESEPIVPVRVEDLDVDPYFANFHNLTVSFRGPAEIHDHDRDDLMTKMAGCEYDPAATSPVWDQFLYQIMGGNQGLTNFLQRAVGYSLTGITSERVIFFMYGSGANGKSTFLNTVAAMLGDYSMRTPTETLLAKKENAIPNDVARLRGARFVYASETEDGKRLAESQIKDLTGGDTVSARFMRGEWFDFKPTFKLWVATNHKPIVRGTDSAIWDRIRLIPFTVVIPEHERNKGLQAQLLGELPGILAWAVRGCQEWREHGLGTPEEVRQATADYRAEMDVLAAFLQESCIQDPQATVAAKALYDAYKRWCEETGEHAVTQRRVGQSLSERSFVRVHDRSGWLWKGLRIAGPGEHSRYIGDPCVATAQSQCDPCDPESNIAAKKNESRVAIPDSGSQGSQGSPIYRQEPRGSLFDTCRLCGSLLQDDQEQQAGCCNRCFG